MTVACRCNPDEPRIVEAAEHGRLRVGTDTALDPLWCPAWPQRLYRRNFLAVRSKRFRTIRPKGQRVPTDWHYSFVG